MGGLYRFFLVLEPNISQYFPDQKCYYVSRDDEGSIAIVKRFMLTILMTAAPIMVELAVMMALSMAEMGRTAMKRLPSPVTLIDGIPRVIPIRPIVLNASSTVLKGITSPKAEMNRMFPIMWSAIVATNELRATASVIFLEDPS